MASRVQLLANKKIAHPPKWLPDNVHYEVIMGSVSYGASSDTSDMDVYGFCIPPKNDIFPHLKGEIPGFGTQHQRFEQYQEHHLLDGKQEYDFTIYSIVKYFQLCMENNPNMVDSLFVPQRCVLFCSRIGQHVRDNRTLFLHKGSFHKFRGYLMAQLHKIETKANSSNPERKETIDKFGYSTKFAYHCIRLGLECEQILESGTLDLERDSEIYKSIRRGEWSLDAIKEWAQKKELHLNDLYSKSQLPNRPDETKLKQLLLECLEEHYGSLTDAIKMEVPTEMILNDLKGILEKYSK